MRCFASSSIVFVLAIAGCGSDADSPTPTDTGIADSGSDLGVDTAIDSKADVPVDVPADTTPDTMDMGVDADAVADTSVTDGDAPAFTTAAFFGCTGTFVDRTGGTATISFVDFAYTPSCMRVKVGQTVTWSGTFAGHPLKGAATNDPTGGLVPATSSGTSASTTFTKAGYYGYYCDFHGDPAGATGTMSGNIEVVP